MERANGRGCPARSVKLARLCVTWLVQRRSRYNRCRPSRAAPGLIPRSLHGISPSDTETRYTERSLRERVQDKHPMLFPRATIRLYPAFARSFAGASSSALH